MYEDEIRDYAYYGGDMSGTIEEHIARISERFSHARTDVDSRDGRTWIDLRARGPEFDARTLGYLAHIHLEPGPRGVSFRARIFLDSLEPEEFIEHFERYGARYHERSVREHGLLRSANDS